MEEQQIIENTEGNAEEKKGSTFSDFMEICESVITFIIYLCCKTCNS